MVKHFILFLSLVILPFASNSQEKEDASKMFRDIVPIEVDRAKFSPPKPASQPVVEDTKGKKGKKKKVEEQPPVEAQPDTLPATMPAPIGEILKRAQNWYIVKSDKFVKSNGANSGKSVSCQVTFPFKQKMLNPENDVDGKITMDVNIEAKDGKYRYTIKNIKHKANKPDMSGGDVYGKVPECGSMKFNDRTWKHVKSEAFACAKIVVDDLKVKMAEEVNDKKDEW